MQDLHDITMQDRVVQAFYDEFKAAFEQLGVKNVDYLEDGFAFRYKDYRYQLTFKQIKETDLQKK